MSAKDTEAASSKPCSAPEASSKQLAAELKRVSRMLQEEMASRKKAEAALKHSREMFQLVVDNIPQAIFWKDRQGNYQGCNQAFAEDAGVGSPQEIHGKTGYDLAWGKEQADFYRKVDERIMGTGIPESHIIAPQLQGNGKLAILDTNKIPLHDAEGNVVGVLGTYENLTNRKHLEELLARERRILEMIATGSPLQGTLDALTQMTEELAVGSYSSILLTDPGKKRLFHASAPSLPQAYLQAVDGLEVGPHSGSCGSAAHFGRMVTVEDTSTDPLWADYRSLADRFGLRSCFSIPILDSSGRVLGTFALYHRKPHRPSEQDLRLVEAAAHLAGIAIEHKKSEEAIRESEEKYRKLFEESRDAIVIVTREGKFIDINQSCLELFGYTRDEIMSEKITDRYVFPADRDRYREIVEKEGSVRDYPLRLRKKNGELMDCLLTSTLKHAKDGSVLGYQGIFRDITERVKAERALRESEARYRGIVEDQTELIFRSLPDQTITFVNEAFCRYFNGKLEDFLGRSFIAFIAEEDRDKVQEELASLNRRNPVGTTSFRVMRPGDETSWQQWTNRLIHGGQNNHVEFQSVGRDITEQIQMEETLRKTAEKIKLFAYSVSHDLKSPAVGLYGLTSLLQRQYGALLDEKGNSYCRQILKASEQIAALVEKINLYISGKEVALLIEDVPLKHILQMIKDEFSARLRSRGIRWKEPANPPVVRADRLGLLRVLRNLVDNALKYGGDDLSEIAVEYDVSDQHHILSVRDNGVGISREDSGKIFELFQRNDKTRGIEGSGLGLAIVKEIAEQHGGTVCVQPGPTGGSVFQISLSRSL